MLYLLLPLIYINDLPDNLTTNAKLFADTSLFSVDRDITISSCDLNDDLKTAKQRAFQRKMRFNLLQWKQAQEVVFSGKFKKQITLRYIFKRVPWRNHIDYGGIIYDQAFHNSFRQKAESLQYNGAIAIAGAIRGTSRENIYQELDLKSVYQRRWYKNLCFFSDIFKI